MEAPSAPDVSPDDVWSVFAQSDRWCTPLTAGEVADTLDCPRQTARRQLEALADRGDLYTKSVDDSSRIWWPVANSETGASDISGRSPTEQLGTFINTVQDYAIFVLDPEGHVASWNDGAERIKGYSEADIIGEHFSTFYTDDDVAAGVPGENLETASTEGRVEDEGWRLRKDGSQFWANVVITAIRDDEGSLQGFTKVTRDLTERREYEIQLRQERDLTEQVLETTPVGICLISSDGVIVRANRYMLDRLGIDETEIDGYSVRSWELYDAEGDPIPVEGGPWIQALETGEPVRDYQCQVDLPGEGRRWLSINAAVLQGGQEEGERVVVSVDDITEQKDRERELRRERNQTEELLRTAPVAIVVQNAAGESVLANQRAQEFLGQSNQGFVTVAERASDWNLYNAEGESLEAGDMPPSRVQATEEPVFEEEIAIEDPSGERKWFSASATPVFGPDGELDRVVTAAEDITLLKRRQRELDQQKSELETELSEILGRISDAFYALDEEWRFTHVNERAAELLNHSQEELLEGRLLDIFPDATDSVVWDRFNEAMETQEPVSFEMEYDPLDIWIEVNAYPSETGLSVYFQDVTDRKEREQALERYRTIVETVNDGIYTVDRDGRFTMVNEAYTEMTGYSREELIGSAASRVVDDDIAEATRQAESELIAGDRETAMIEADVITADGGRIPAEATFTLFPSDRGYERIGVVRDVTRRKAQERAIEESERRYRTLAENFPNGAVGLFDEDLRYTAVGGELLDATDIHPVDRIGSSVYDIYPDELVEEIEPYFQAALEGEPSTFEAEYYDRYLFAHTLPVENDDGEVFAGMLVVQDITERRKTQRELRESEARFRMIAENLDEIVWMATEDADEFIYINPAFEDVWGLDREALYADPNSFLEAVHPDDRDRVRDEFAGLPESEFEDEYRIVRPDGAVRWVYARGTQVEDEDSEIARIVGIGDDVTERVERERELERARDLLARTERIADVGGWEIDADTMDVFWTDHIFDLLEVDSDEEPPLDQALDMYYEADRPRVESAVENALDSGEPFDIEVRIRTESGEVRWLRLQGVPEIVDDEVVSFRGAAQDITERKQREQRLEELIEKLEESNERLEQFAYIASHDLQEPLRMVSSYLQLLEDRYRQELDEDAKEFIDYAVDGADRMRQMVADLLAYSRLDSDANPLEPTDPQAVLDDVLDQLQLQIQETDAEVIVEDLPAVNADASQLEQVFQNLVANAIKYRGDDPPRIEIGAERDGEMIRFQVADNGIGIDPAYHDQIFRVFNRLHKHDEYPGTGIGLALCKKIVHRHGGEIWIESDPAEGSTFYFTIPSVNHNST